MARSLIKAYCTELDHYSTVFFDRIVPAFTGLEKEAEKIQEETYERLGQFFNPDYGDPADSAEQAYFAGVDHYVALDAVHQGIYNLMVAGLFHLLEQQIRFLTACVLLNRAASLDAYPGFNDAKAILKDHFKVDIESFKCWSQLHQLNLLANTVKHGDGRSSSELKELNPDLFRDPGFPNLSLHGVPLRPLVGEGLRLSPVHFTTFKTCIELFWEELSTVLFPSDLTT